MLKKSAQLQINVSATEGAPDQKISKDSGVKVHEGVVLSEKEQQYLLPHFTMMLVGKPGSGKTSVIKQLLNSKAYYYQKFDDVLLMSPSATKMEIKVRKEHMTQVFSLKWIEQKLWEINKKQQQSIMHRLRELGIIDKFEHDKLTGKLGDEISLNLNPGESKLTVQPNLYQEKERFFQPSFFKVMQKPGAPSNSVLGKRKKTPAEEFKKDQDLAQYVDEMHQRYVLKLPAEDRNRLYKNVLIVMDDMVSQIKAEENNPLLTQLIFNRRHLVMNGMISMIIVSQKYTMIPARVRSNANWLILFRLNPNDFETVFKDVVMMHHNQWDQLLDYVFGGVEKKYNNLGIWVEQDAFFMNFKKLLINQQETQ